MKSNRIPSLAATSPAFMLNSNLILTLCLAIVVCNVK